MTADELLAMLADLGVTGAGTAFGLLTAEVPPDRWRAVAENARDRPEIGCRFFDWLSAYDDSQAGIAVVAHVWSVQRRHAIALRTRVPRETAELDSLTDVWAGADWHERETYEMFGVRFIGHPDLRSLLLPNGFEGNPLRKEFVLASRVAKPWPGAKEPGQSDADLAAGAVRRSRRLTPLGRPDDGAWGTDADSARTVGPT